MPFSLFPPNFDRLIVRASLKGLLIQTEENHLWKLRTDAVAIKIVLANRRDNEKVSVIE